jgi:hypothetical protein
MYYIEFEAGFPSHSSTIRVGGHERATISAIRLVNGQQIVSASIVSFALSANAQTTSMSTNGWLYHAHN